MRPFIRLRRVAWALFASTIACSAAAAPRSQLQRDVEGYAIASCLAEQGDATLRTQGEGWARMIFMGRAKGETEEWMRLDRAVARAVNPADIPLLKPERPTDPSPELPLAYCAEIIDTPRVRTAIDTAARRLARDYRKR